MIRKKNARAALLAAVTLLAACSRVEAMFGHPAKEEKAAASVAAHGVKPTGSRDEKLSNKLARGKALYKEKCGMCHGAVGMGTGLIARRTKPAQLSERTDLTADFVMQAARTGTNNMPAIPRGEASDEQLRLIAEYLARKRSAK